MKNKLILAALLGITTHTSHAGPDYSVQVDTTMAVALQNSMSDWRDKVLIGAAGGLAILNLWDLYSNEQKRELMRKAINGEITGKPRMLLLARLGGSILGIATAAYTGIRKPFLRHTIASCFKRTGGCELNRIKNEIKGLGEH